MKNTENLGGENKGSKIMIDSDFILKKIKKQFRLLPTFT